MSYVSQKRQTKSFRARPIDYFALENCDKIKDFRFNVDACLMHEPELIKLNADAFFLSQFIRKSKYAVMTL